MNLDNPMQVEPKITTPAEAIAALDAIDSRKFDGEGLHSIADDIVLELLENLHPEVVEAYNRVRARAPWWAFA